ncbi:MAG TPA: peptide chain release factor N(5)-glutamine methyltransferase [Pyrinomonadaceae bacterium]
MDEQEHSSIVRLIANAARVLSEAGVPDARREAMSLVGHVTKYDRTFLLTHPETTLRLSDVEYLSEMVERRAQGEPLQYITGHQEFYGLDFEVTRDVLIPRPETELLVETALGLLGQSNESQLICDVGTGSGCIAIALLHERPLLRAVGLDISLTALNIAERNAQRLAVSERFSLTVSDGFDALNSTGLRFKMIVSNPPYVAEDALLELQREVRDFEPHVALTPGGDGLSIIRRLLADAPHYLESGGHLLIEIGFDQHEAVSQVLDREVWQLLDIYKDLQGIPRTVALKKR